MNKKHIDYNHIWSSPETEAVVRMLDADEDHKFDILDRFDRRDLSDDAVFEETVRGMAFVLEDELRADIRFHFIDASMWREIVFPYLEKADYSEIAKVWLERLRNRK